MGSGIAAHFANLGYRVILFDRTKPEAVRGHDRAKMARPAHFVSDQIANGIVTAGLDQDLALLRECDWVCEAIFENMSAKHTLYQEIAGALAAHAVLTSNTSGLSISELAEVLPESLQGSFMGTHFFNPPRYLKLMELVPGAKTSPTALSNMAEFLETAAGRRVVIAKDTPGFITNRFGMWCMYHATHVAEKLGLTIEQTDLITGPLMGRPKSGTFRLNDLVGIDVMQDIARNLQERCLEDPYIARLQDPPSLSFLAAKGWMGEKTKQGYYKKEGNQLVAFDLRTQAYRELHTAEFGSVADLIKLPLPERLAKMITLKDEVGEFAREFLLPAVKYAHYLNGEISHSIQDFDRAMMWGFGWELGPFAIADALGVEATGLAEGPNYIPAASTMRSYSGGQIAIPDEPEYRSFTDFPLIEAAEGVNFRDLGDGILGIGLATKMGILNPSLVTTIREFLAKNNPPRVILAGETRAYSAGFNLQFFLDHAEPSLHPVVDEALSGLQELSRELGHRTSVAAVHGFCLGGGFELALGCTRIVAQLEAQIGLPEVLVGLIPAGGGTARMRLNHQPSAKSLSAILETLTRGHRCANAVEAKDVGLLTPLDVIEPHPDRLITRAIEVVLDLEAESKPEWLPVQGPLAGMVEQFQEKGRNNQTMTEYDTIIGDRMKAVFVQSQSFDEALKRERQEFLELLKEGRSLARVRHMMESNRPLRN